MNYRLKIFILFQIFIIFFSLIIFIINNNIKLNIFDIYNLIINKKINLGDLGFFYGELIQNYLNSNQFYLILDDTKLFVGRPLFIAIFITFLLKITSLEFFIILIKNSIFFSIYFISVCEFFKQNYLKNYKFIFLLIAPFLLPYNLYQSFQLIPEESYLIFLIPSIFLYIISESKNRIFLTLIFIITLYTKSPNIIIILSLSILLFTKYFRINASGLILVSLILSSLVWGSYGYKKSQFFPFFHKSYTVNSFTGLQSHNIFFKYFYPEYTVDEIVSYFDFFKQNSNNKSEKNYEKILSDEKSKFIKENFLEYLDNKLTILNHMFFNIKKDGSVFTAECKRNFKTIISRMKSDNKIYKMEENEKNLMKNCKKNNQNEIRINYIINKILWISSLCIALLNLTYTKKNIKISFLFIYINFFYLLPYVYGHVYTRHLIVLFMLSIIFLIINFDFTKLFKKKL